MQALAGNAVVAEVAEDISQVGQAVIFSTEAQVAFIVEPGCHGAAAGYQHPLPNVKLPAHEPHQCWKSSKGVLGCDRLSGSRCTWDGKLCAQYNLFDVHPYALNWTCVSSQKAEMQHLAVNGSVNRAKKKPCAACHEHFISGKEHCKGTEQCVVFTK